MVNSGGFITFDLPKQLRYMFRKLMLVFTGLLLATIANAQLNVTFRSNLPYNGALANIGGYVDGNGTEYALVGYEFGLSIVNLADPANPFVAFDVTGTTSDWREVKTWQEYAYVTTEGCCNGLQIINLSYLPDSIQVKTWQGDGAITGQLETIHALHIDNGFAYLFGSNLFNGAAVIADLADPWNPTYKGNTPGTYIHDGYVRNDTLWAGHIYDGYFSVMDVSDKTNPLLLATQNTPGLFTHNTWLNDQGNVLFTTDEVNSSYLTSYDISDLNNITELQRVQLTPGSGSVVHNTHTLNDYEIVSWYKDGIAIVDVSRPDNMIVTGHYDTFLQGSGGGFDGCWGVYPYLPSGTIVASDMSNGLYVLTPNYVRGCYLEGTITDSVSGMTLNAATINILNQNTTKQSNISGVYKTGLATAGTYDVEVSKPGYITKTITGVVLQNGVLTQLDVQLNSLPTIVVTGQVTITNNGLPIEDAIVHISNSQFDVQVQTDASGNFALQGFYAGTYDVQIGKWGYVTKCLSSESITGASPLNITLDIGYYDDFSLDFGWNIGGTSPNAWVRDVPVGTSNNGTPANPGNDVNGDCGTIAFVTDNGGGSASAHDIDNGNCILTSPVFDATIYTNPYVTYYRWFFNGATFSGQPDDTMKIILNNGITSAVIEQVNPSSIGNSSWIFSSHRIADFITPTATMQLIVDIGDPGPVLNLLEGGFDHFTVDNIVGVESLNTSNLTLKAQPNPFTGNVYISWSTTNEGATLEVYDVSGREVFHSALTGQRGTVEAGNEWPSGYYLARLIAGNEINFVKIVKQ
jgi:choice-of-anchor B domain-containing protein